MKTLYPILFILFCCNEFSYAQVKIDSNTPVTVDFTTSVTGVNLGKYFGSGFKPVGGVGFLNSNAWASTGMSDGDLNFGDVNTSGDYARSNTSMPNPATDPGATIGGFYSLLGNPFGSSGAALYIQPMDDDFTPGTLTMRIENTHAVNHIYLLDISYDLWIRNNRPSSNSFNFSYSPDDVTYTAVPTLNYSTPTTADLLGIVSTGAKFCSITGLDIIPSGYFYLRWTMSDVSGFGERDEFFMDDVTVTAPNILPVELVNFTGALVNEVVELNWTTVTEIENDKFIIQKSIHSEKTFFDIGSVEAGGNSTAMQSYYFIDEEPTAGLLYYRLKQLDTDGSYSYSKTIAVQVGNDHNDLIIYPNPASASLYVNSLLLNEEGAVINISDMAGRNLIILNNKGTSQDSGEMNTIMISLRDVPDGVYLLSIITTDTKITKQFVKKSTSAIEGF
ncbi:MAG: T9SS type A sorting domain-containing protein [Chitinophagales bacterium]|nr:T9SS type A sorting domain-containing protein [Chitinophagales bacterium]